METFYLGKINKKKGYTLIETMVAVSLFIVIVMTGLTTLLNANLLNQKSRDLRSIMDNLSFILEDMSRNLRTGSNYQCFDSAHPNIFLGSPASCQNGWAIAFEPAGGNVNSNNDQWIYYISNDGKIFKSVDGGNTSVQLSPDEVTITSVYGFSVLGAEGPTSGDRQQPFVTIRLVGVINFKNVVTPFSLQTSVSQRYLDI